ncbi:MAG: hypothetical protein IJI05_00690 [Erysipelotrichaceae bacterium]|nr:hypothetical protein [Erysipelotrichaceae bacterium]
MRRTVIMIITGIMLLFSLCGCAEGNPIDTSIKNNNPNTVNNVIDSQIKKETGQQDDPVSEKDKSPVDTTGSSFYQKQDIDLDLTNMTSNMIFATVSNMMATPDNFADKVVRFSGYFLQSRDASSDKVYNCCIVPDALACCAEGLEFVLLDGYSYPEEGQDIMITGVFRVYYNESFSYCVIENAEIKLI